MRVTSHSWQERRGLSSCDPAFLKLSFAETCGSMEYIRRSCSQSTWSCTYRRLASGSAAFYIEQSDFLRKKFKEENKKC